MSVDPLLADLNKLRDKSRQNTATLLRIIDSTIDALEGGTGSKRAGTNVAGALGEPVPAGSEGAPKSRVSIHFDCIEEINYSARSALMSCCRGGL